MSNGCQKHAVALSAYFDGELEGENLQEMEQHLAECEACQHSLQRFGQLRGALHRLAGAAPDKPRKPGRSMLDDLREKLKKEPAGDARNRLIS